MSPPPPDAAAADHTAPRTRATRRTASLFAALGDPTRLSLLARLSGSPPASISRLTRGTPLTRQAVTKHLDVLHAARLVRCVRRGRETLYHLNPHRLTDARDALDRIARQWDNALARLKAFVES